jgi:hypothetical protein
VTFYFIFKERFFLAFIPQILWQERYEEFYFGILKDNTPLDASFIKINIGFAIKVLFSSIFLLIVCGD